MGDVWDLARFLLGRLTREASFCQPFLLRKKKNPEIKKPSVLNFPDVHTLVEKNTLNEAVTVLAKKL